MIYCLTVLKEVDSLFFQDLPKIERMSGVHPKKPLHSLYIHFKASKAQNQHKALKKLTK